ncbi:peptidase inhibitor family I36 protein [Naasia lichenicola]|nr:peptidase inhibitor family I36 protein [Naasia lichenicola]
MIAATAAVLLIQLSLVAAPATAAVADRTRTVEHCAIEVPSDDTETTTDSDTADLQPVCFFTEEEVEAYIEESANAGRGSGASVAAASVVLGVVYKDINYGGSSLTLFASSDCNGTTHGFPTLSSGWDNSISSAKGSSTCWLTLYTATSYGGSRLNCTPNCASIGSWNDQVKSIIFRQTGLYG